MNNGPPDQEASHMGCQFMSGNVFIREAESRILISGLSKAVKTEVPLVNIAKSKCQRCWRPLLRDVWCLSFLQESEKSLHPCHLFFLCPQQLFGVYLSQMNVLVTVTLL